MFKSFTIYRNLLVIRKDDPQRISESLHSTGLDVSQSDLIRNFILMDLLPKDQNRIFEIIWNPIEENAKDSIK
jgi:uncharacterized protein with ParB-like and HNH nuclease domain